MIKMQSKEEIEQLKEIATLTGNKVVFSERWGLYVLKYSINGYGLENPYL